MTQSGSLQESSGYYVAVIFEYDNDCALLRVMIYKHVSSNNARMIRNIDTKQNDPTAR